MENITWTEEQKKFVEEQMREKQQVVQREQTLNDGLKDDTFKFFYENGMKDMIEKDKSILDSPKAIELAMTATKNQIELAELKAKQQQAEVKQEEPKPVETSGPATQVSSASTGGDDSNKTLKSLKELDPRELTNASIGGKVAASILSGKPLK